jgi:hypothetical protein
MKIVALRAIRQRKVYNFLTFSVELGTKTKITRKHMIIPHRKPKI